jgi:hypothetical protein
MENRKLLKDLEDKYLATAPLPPKPKPKPKPKRTAKTSPARSSPAK